jgi:hypothetical protein
MCSCARRLFRLGLLVVAACAFFGLQAVAPASAAPGTVLKDLTVPNSAGGVSVAFDGKYLYYTNLDGAVLHRVTPSDAAASDIPVIGMAGVNGLSYDVVHDAFWAVDRSGLGIYRIAKDGLATLQFTIVPAFDLPGLCDVPLGCNRIVSGLAYDGTDSLWYAPQGSERVYHFTTSGQLLGYFDTDAGASALVPDCVANTLSGIAAGSSSLYLAAGSCGRAFRYAKSDGASSKLGTFPMTGGAGDIECDDITFGPDAVWVRGTDGHLRAIEAPAGLCPHGGGQVLDDAKRWMTGTGVAVGTFLREPEFPFPGIVVDAPHSFILYCDPANFGWSRLSVTWVDSNGTKWAFYLKSVVATNCSDPCDPTQLDCVNQAIGTGLGKLTRNGVVITGGSCTTAPNCGQIDFGFFDNGPPRTSATQVGVVDTGSFSISDLTIGFGILDTCACKRADYRMHECG